jgi:ABC-2 type transport system permease protein
MLRWVPIFKREFKECLQSPATWIALALLFLFSGYIFTELIVTFSNDSQQAINNSMFGVNKPPNATEDLVRTPFAIMNTMILFSIPLFTMRLIAEEKNRGTFELLVTCPVGDWSILLGKYFASLAIGLIIVAGMMIYPCLAHFLGQANGSYIEWPIVFSCATSLFLVFATFSAFGLMTSTFTDNQLTAAIVTLVGLLMWTVLGASELSQPEVKLLLRTLSVSAHSDYLVKGIVQMKDIAFFALSSFLFLFVASKTLESRRWRV